ncbi:unnamed protein product [Orchesella dallaii]|uniref:Gustatory receptor n=1 Tax=Orchesella dallaii TaxID=48710 RepID=A0ABP1PSI6_9HEXA
MFISLMTFLVCFINLYTTIIRQYRNELRSVYLGVIDLDKKLTASYNGQIEQGKEIKIFEYSIFLICAATILVPLGFIVTFYHPADPLHRILEDLLEVRVKLSWKMFATSCVYVGLAFNAGNTIAVFLGIGFLNLAFFALWLKAIQPREPLKAAGNELNNTQRYRTSQLGNQSANKLIHTYRCVAIQCIYLNVIFAKIRVSAHCLACLLLVVFGTYLLIRYGENLINDMEYVFVSLILCSIFIPVIIMKIECSTFGGMQDDCDNFKKVLMNTNGRRREVWKTALSLRGVVIMSTYPFFSIGHDTFLAFMDICVDNVVSLLCL